MDSSGNQKEEVGANIFCKDEHCGSVDRTIATDNGNRLICNIEQTANLLGRMHEER